MNLQHTLPDQPEADTSQLEITPDDVAACFRPWTGAPSPEGEPPDQADHEDPLPPVVAADILHSLVSSLAAGVKDTPEDKLRRKAAALHMFRRLDAQQPVEAALATHAVLAHYAAVAAFRRSGLPGQFSDITSRENGSAIRMSKEFRSLLGALESLQDQPSLLPARNQPRWRR
jgi:hypothetical protein